MCNYCTQRGDLYEDMMDFKYNFYFNTALNFGIQVNVCVSFLLPAFQPCEQKKKLTVFPVFLCTICIYK